MERLQLRMMEKAKCNHVFNCPEDDFRGFELVAVCPYCGLTRTYLSYRGFEELGAEKLRRRMGSRRGAEGRKLTLINV